MHSYETILFQEDGTDDEENENVKIEEKIWESEELGETSSHVPSLNLSILHCEEVTSLS